MRVVHGLWAREALCLWAEDPDLPPVPAARGLSPAPHPFACQAAELADVLAALPGPAGEAARKAVDAELTLQLPSAAGPARPLASPELLRPPEPHASPEPHTPAEPHASHTPASAPRVGRVRLARWRVPVLAFAPAAALD